MSELIICISKNTNSPNMILFCHVLIGIPPGAVSTHVYNQPTMLNNSTNMLPAANMDSDGINRMSKYLREKNEKNK